MKKILSTLLFGTIAVSAMATIRYCDPASTRSTGQATSWETAISVETLRRNLSSIKENDTICIKGGTILVTQLSEVFNVSKSFTIIGGFDPATTQPFTTLPDYPSATPTIFSGDVNKNGKPDAGDAVSLMRVDYSSDTTRTLHLIGCDFVNTYYDGEVDSPNDVLTSTAKCAALRILCGKAFVRFCNFYNHVTPNGRGSQCVTSVGAKLHMSDCELHDCISLTRGSLLRSRQYFVNQDANQPINPDCVLERCCLYNGNNMAGDEVNTAGFYGGAVQISYGPFFAINTTIANSKGYSDGGGLNTNVSGATLISCTIVNNSCARATKEDEAAASRNSYGSNFHIDKDGKVRIANSIVLGPNDNGSKQHAVLYSSDNVNSINDNCISGGYNITGTFFYYKNGVEENDQTATWLATDKYSTPKGTTVQTMVDYIGANPQMSDNGGFSKTIQPLEMQNGDNIAHLQQLADQWCPSWTKVDASVDQRGYMRDNDITCVGALAMESTSALEETSQSINPSIHQSFNILGQPVDENYKGIIILKGKKYLLQ